MLIFEAKRCHLGSSTTKSPAQKSVLWMINNLSRIVFAIIACFLWLGILFAGVGITVFLGSNVGSVWDKETVSSVAIYNSSIVGILKIVGCIIAVWYVMATTSKSK